MLHINPFNDGSYEKEQVAAPIPSKIPGKSGQKKTRIRLTTGKENTYPLLDASSAEKTHYAVAGRILKDDEVEKHLKKRLSKEVVLTATTDQGIVQYVLINKASLAKRHDISLFQVEKEAQKTRRILLKNFINKDPNQQLSDAIIKESPLSQLLTSRIQKEVAMQKKIKDFIALMKAPQEQKLKNFVNTELLHIKEIPHPPLRRAYQRILKALSKESNPDKYQPYIHQLKEQIWWDLEPVLTGEKQIPKKEEKKEDEIFPSKEKPPPAHKKEEKPLFLDTESQPKPVSAFDKQKISFDKQKENLLSCFNEIEKILENWNEKQSTKLLKNNIQLFLKQSKEYRPEIIHIFTTFHKKFANISVWSKKEINALSAWIHSQKVVIQHLPLSVTFEELKQDLEYQKHLKDIFGDDE